mmetsp:Transcript_24923/g.21803  ORF Transcript_24923/g.21803 Transcript_24923/m.21803 type:complete len:267 (+) Transcript_24923:2-802(+)
MSKAFQRMTSKRETSTRYLVPMMIGLCCLYSRMVYSQKISNHNSDIRLICISDTHNGYKSLTKQLIDLYQSEKDILIHAGDMTDRGSMDELNDINDWFGKLPYKYKIVISGNMDGIGLDNHNLNGYKIFTNAIYLQHETFTIQEIGLKIFASPYTPQFVGGFQLYSDKESEEKWKDIPTDTDVLITHGPPYHVLDSTSRGKSIGDNMLWNQLNHRIRPKAMVFGHVHASFGTQQVNGVQYVNAAQFNGIYSGDKSVRPVVVNINLD